MLDLPQMRGRRFVPGLDRAARRITVAGGGQLSYDYLVLANHPSLREYAHQQLRARGVDVRLDTKISGITEDRVLLADGKDLLSNLTVWAAGVSAPEPAGSWNLPQGQGGRLVTGPDLGVAGHDRIFAVGDIALIDGQPSLPDLEPQWRGHHWRRPADPPGECGLIAEVSRWNPAPGARLPS